MCCDSVEAMPTTPSVPHWKCNKATGKLSSTSVLFFILLLLIFTSYKTENPPIFILSSNALWLLTSPLKWLLQRSAVTPRYHIPSDSFQFFYYMTFPWSLTPVDNFPSSSSLKLSSLGFWAWMTEWERPGVFALDWVTQWSYVDFLHKFGM